MGYESTCLIVSVFACLLIYFPVVLYNENDTSKWLGIFLTGLNRIVITISNNLNG